VGKIDRSAAAVGGLQGAHDRHDEMTSHTETDFTVSDEDIKASVTRATQGTMDGVFRVKPTGTHGDNMESLNQQTLDYYCRRLDEVKRGEFAPTPLRMWSSVVAHFQRFLADRIPENIKQFRKRGGSGDMRIALIPFMYRITHPTAKERDAWMKGWDDDGEFLKATMAMLMTIPTDKPRSYALLPNLIFCASSPRSPVMLSLMLVESDV
jgi:hypothetical protein